MERRGHTTNLALKRRARTSFSALFLHHLDQLRWVVIVLSRENEEDVGNHEVRLSRSEDLAEPPGLDDLLLHPEAPIKQVLKGAPLVGAVRKTLDVQNGHWVVLCDKRVPEQGLP